MAAGAVLVTVWWVTRVAVRPAARGRYRHPAGTLTAWWVGEPVAARTSARRTVLHGARRTAPGWSTLAAGAGRVDGSTAAPGELIAHGAPDPHPVITAEWIRDHPGIGQGIRDGIREGIGPQDRTPGSDRTRVRSNGCSRGPDRASRDTDPHPDGRNRPPHRFA